MQFPLTPFLKKWQVSLVSLRNTRPSTAEVQRDKHRIDYEVVGGRMHSKNKKAAPLF